MSSFYGNVSSRPQSAFMFDRIYTTRKAMDENAASDGIFVGRYVLIDYGNPLMEGYYKSADGKFYADAEYEIELSKIENALYKDKTSSGTSTEGQIYQYAYVEVSSGETGETGETGEPVKDWQFVVYSGSSAPTDYQATDIAKYGRGFDSTVWMKTATGKYVLVAELAPSIPEFEIKANPPTITPVAPYFDKNTTNQNYIMHVQGQYGQQIAVEQGVNSDAQINYKKCEYDDSTHTWGVTDVTAWGDIYYNYAGAAYNTRHYDDTTENAINYNLISSGLNYYNSNNGTGETALDTMAWYIHLPIIGNMLCQAWDTLYGEVENHQDRLTGILNDIMNNVNDCSFDEYSIVGIGNTMRAFMGKTESIYNYLTTSAANNILFTDTSFEVILDNIKPANGTEQAKKDNLLKLNKKVLFKQFTITDPDTQEKSYYITYYSPTYLYTDNTEVTYGWHYMKMYTVETTEMQYITNPGLEAIALDNQDSKPQTLLGSIAYFNRLVGVTDDNNNFDTRTIMGNLRLLQAITMDENIDGAGYFLTALHNPALGTTGNSSADYLITNSKFPIGTSADVNKVLSIGSSGEGIWSPRIANFKINDIVINPLVNAENAGTIMINGDSCVVITGTTNTLNFSHAVPSGISGMTSFGGAKLENNILQLPVLTLDDCGHITGTTNNTALGLAGPLGFTTDASTIILYHAIPTNLVGNTSYDNLPAITVDSFGHITTIANTKLINYTLENYVKTNVTGPLGATDTLSVALSKIENGLANSNITYNDLVKNFNLTLNSNTQPSNITFTQDDCDWTIGSYMIYYTSVLKLKLNFTPINNNDTYTIEVHDTNSTPVVYLTETITSMPTTGIILTKTFESSTGAPRENFILNLKITRNWDGLSSVVFDNIASLTLVRPNPT